ncbi:MAG: DUF547 domain-containing protein [Acidimicrobiia bacterium]|nr:DUF547 domain-containing protein [Acidimicrobiia bacterium]
MSGPNPLVVFLSILRARRLRAPDPAGTGRYEHGDLAPVLAAVADRGVAGLSGRAGELAAIVDRRAAVDPDTLGRDEALAFWLNLYNAGALDAARRAFETGETSVLGVPGAFDEAFVEVAGESLTLDGIEHGKIRRFGDPRIHGALVCGSVSCPTLRREPYEAARLDAQLDAQLRSFLAHGGADDDRELGVLRLSRVFLWYGADFTRPRRMPTLLPTTKRRLRDALTPWLPAPMRGWVGAVAPKVEYLPYDWGLGCSVR